MSLSRIARSGVKNPYSQIFTIPGSRAFSASAAVARLPMSMISLGVVLAVNQLYGDWTNAGTLSAVYVMSSAVVTPLFARLFDRHGQRVVGRLALPLSFLTLAALTLALFVRSPLWLLYPLAILTGLTQISFGALVRTRWTWVLQAGRSGGTGPADEPVGGLAPTGGLKLVSAYSFESAVDELIYVVGPVFATSLATMVHPVSQLVVPMIALAIGGSVFFSLSSARAPARTLETVEVSTRRPDSPVAAGSVTADVTAADVTIADVTTTADAGPGERINRPGQPGGPESGEPGQPGCPGQPGYPDRLGCPDATHPRRSVHSLVSRVRSSTALGFPGMGLLICSFLVFSMSFSAYDVTLLAMTKAQGQEYVVGIVMATFAGGSMVGALVYGSHRWPGSLWTRYVFCLSVLTVGFASFFFLRGNLPALCLAQFISGLFIAPAFASSNMIIEDSVPGPYLTEGLSWLTTGAALGSSLGSTLAGVLIDRVGLSAAFMIPWTSVFVALLIVLIFRRGLLARLVKRRG